MSRRKGQTKAAGLRRGRLEDAVAMLVRAEVALPVVRLRVAQALERTGLVGLLAPALEELDEVACALVVAKQVVAAEAEGASSDGNAVAGNARKLPPGGAPAGRGQGLPENC